MNKKVNIDNVEVRSALSTLRQRTERLKKNRRKKEKEVLGGAIATILFFAVLWAVIGALCFPYAINSWLVFAGKAAVVKWYHGAALGFVPYIGKFTIPVALVTWILLLILV